MSEACANEVLGLLGDLGRLRVGWELHLVRVEHDPLPQDDLLALALAKWSLAEQHLIEDDAHRPHVDLTAYSGASIGVPLGKALRGQVPVGPCALRSQLQALILIRIIHDL